MNPFKPKKEDSAAYMDHLREEQKEQWLEQDNEEHDEPIQRDK